MSRLILIILFLEVGFVLTIAPWSAYWERNYFAETLPFIHDVIRNNFVRGAVTGLGIGNVGAAVLDLVSLFLGRHGRPVAISVTATTPPAEDS